MVRLAATRSRSLLARLLVGTLVPTVAALGVFGVLAHEVARRALDEELGRRLATAAAGAAATVLPEQLEALRAGDEDSLTYANVRRKLEVARERLGVRRVMAVAADLSARGDTAGTLALGARAYELEADSIEIGRALKGAPAASPLFVGHDGVAYKRGYAAIGDGGGLIAVEGSADYYAALAAFRHRLLAAGALALLAVFAVTAFVARRISGPVVRLADAAARLGRGELATRIPVETRDEIGFLAATLDDARAALQARDEHMQMMVAGIAHEVRNPLGGLELYAGLLRDALAGEPERLQEVGRIERELGHLRTVVSEFLDYARRPPPELTRLAVRPLLEEVRDLTATPGVAVTVDAPATLEVRADAGQLRRALLNLARNAASVMEGRAGGVVLAATRTETRVHLEVRDRGPGVPVDLREKIFTPFFTTREKGTGLGLAFVREIVRDHGGDVVVQDAPGGGAVFRIDLPSEAAP
ncbi:MAG: integral rane sensor signal transduction histidine kinase [Myxococcales bacterium]|nr:integral rane sensor signal transduction histidine kinase [Myxococcales bacterium]